MLAGTKCSRCVSVSGEKGKKGEGGGGQLPEIRVGVVHSSLSNLTPSSLTLGVEAALPHEELGCVWAWHEQET